MKQLCVPGLRPDRLGLIEANSFFAIDVMNRHHQVNRAEWNRYTPVYKLRVGDGWKGWHLNPARMFTQSEIDALGDLEGERACILGSGNNSAAFALAGMGANVTSVDISDAQLGIAKSRARNLDLNISFVTSDVTDLGFAEESFQAIYTGGHVAMWVSDLHRYYAEAARILKPGGVLVITEYHPFRELWSQSTEHLIVEKPYGERGPYLEEGKEGDPYVFTWTVSDYVNAILDSGLELVKFEEIPNLVEESEGRQSRFRGLPEDIFLVGRKR